MVVILISSSSWVQLSMMLLNNISKLLVLQPYYHIGHLVGINAVTVIKILMLLKQLLENTRKTTFHLILCGLISIIWIKPRTLPMMPSTIQKIELESLLIT
eukprot:jgi/Orpsp1_1/1179394/evm.model.c7180000069145.1